MPNDTLQIDNNSIVNTTSNGKFYSIPEDTLTNILADCYFLGEIEEQETPVVLTDANRFENIAKIMIETFTKKNHDYGNSFEQSLDEEGLAAARIRMGDKWNRFKTLSKGISAQVNDESLRDTLLDLSVYSIMTLIWLDKNGENKGFN